MLPIAPLGPAGVSASGWSLFPIFGHGKDEQFSPETLIHPFIRRLILSPNSYVRQIPQIGYPLNNCSPKKGALL